jgi:hypothetical protein
MDAEMVINPYFTAADKLVLKSLLKDVEKAKQGGSEKARIGDGGLKVEGNDSPTSTTSATDVESLKGTAECIDW